MVLNYDSGTIHVGRRQSGRALVQDVQFSLAAGRSLALIGETGSGKTMTALSIMGLLPRNVSMQGGRITFLGQELSGNRARLLGDRIVYIPQNGLEFLNPSRTVLRHLEDSLKRIGVPRRQLAEAAREKLKLAGFPEPDAVLGLYPFQLSGGMAQRVTIAIAACSRASLVIADEPTNGLDEAGRRQFLQLLAQVFPEAARLIITHDITLAELCDETLVLCRGRMMEKGPSGQVLGMPRSCYTGALLQALVRSGMQETPVLRQEAVLCPFYSRCPHACTHCRQELAHHRESQAEWWCNQPQ